MGGCGHAYACAEMHIHTLTYIHVCSQTRNDALAQDNLHASPVCSLKISNPRFSACTNVSPLQFLITLKMANTGGPLKMFVRAVAAGFHVHSVCCPLLNG